MLRFIELIEIYMQNSYLIIIFINFIRIIFLINISFLFLFGLLFEQKLTFVIRIHNYLNITKNRNFFKITKKRKRQRKILSNFASNIDSSLKKNDLTCHTRVNKCNNFIIYHIYLHYNLEPKSI